MAVTLVQSPSNASGSAAPASVQPTFTSTTAGNFLLMAVTSTGASPTITTPAGWTLIVANADSARAISLFAYPNNPGAITSVTVTLTNSTGACVYAFEFAGMPPAPVNEFNAATFTNGIYITSMFPPASISNQLGFWCVGGVTTTLTPVMTSEWSPLFVKTSSSGAPNAILNCAWYANQVGPATPQNSGTLLAADVYMLGARWLTTQSGGITHCPAGGMSGQLVGQFFQGMIGG